MHFLQAMELAFFVFVFISRQQETMIIVSCRKSVLFPIIHQWDIQADLLIQLHSCLLLICKGADGRIIESSSETETYNGIMIYVTVLKLALWEEAGNNLSWLHASFVVPQIPP